MRITLRVYHHWKYLNTDSRKMGKILLMCGRSKVLMLMLAYGLAHVLRKLQVLPWKTFAQRGTVAPGKARYQTFDSYDIKKV